MVGYGGKDLQKRKVLSLEWKSEGVMDDESGESMEPMEEVPLIHGESLATGGQCRSRGRDGCDIQERNSVSGMLTLRWTTSCRMRPTPLNTA